MQVVLGLRTSAVVSDAQAAYEAQRFPTIEFSPIEGQEKPLVFAVRKNAHQLRKQLDEWLKDPKEADFRNALVGKLPASSA